jgi:hypothetical protein
MKREDSSQKWGGGGLLTPIMASPFALQSIFLALFIPGALLLLVIVPSPKIFMLQQGKASLRGGAL